MVDVWPVRHTASEAELLAGHCGCVDVQGGSTHRSPQPLHLVLQVPVARIVGVVKLQANILICTQTECSLARPSNLFVTSIIHLHNLLQLRQLLTGKHRQAKSIFLNKF